MMHYQIGQVLRGLKRVVDPELGIDMVSLGLLYEVVVEDADENKVRAIFLDEYEEEVDDEFETVKRVRVKMTLTTPGCPLGGYFLDRVAGEVAEELGLDRESVGVQIVFDPPWTPTMMTEESRAELGME